MKNRSGEKIKLASIDELLGVVNEESAMEIEISKIHPFKNHPFKVLDDEKMQDLVESVKINGVLTPVLLRMDENEEYEMVSGHRRMHAAQLAGLTTIPAIVRELSDDDAIVAMVDANIQREELLPSEKAFAYKMKLEAMKSKSADKIKMPSIDELLGVSGEESATDIEISRIHSFANHPFKVLDDDKMDDLVESIKQNGVLTPVLVRPDKNNSYEMISGHRRMHAAIKAGLETIPAIVRDMDDDDAVVVMVDANIQREELLPSEKAFAYKMKMDAMKRQAGRPSKNNSTQVGRNFETAELIGKETGESKNTIRRFIRLTELIPELLDYNVLNNGFGEKERREEIRKAAESYQQKTGATITFFAAVCEEFPSMGNYFDGLTIEQVTDRYKQILADPKLSYMGNGMGFELHDSSLPDYLDGPMTLIKGHTIYADNIDSIWNSGDIYIEGKQM